MNDTILKKLAKPLIILATIIWGVSFVIVKNTLDTVPTLFLLAVRFLVAAVFLAVIFYRCLKKIDKQYILYGSIMGLLLLSAYTAQTFGLTDTTPGKNAFLTASYCIIVPFFNWYAEKKRPNIYNMLAALLCLGGIGLVSLNGAFVMTKGDALTLLCGFFYAAHIIAVNKFSKGRDIFLLTILQFAAAGIVSLVFSLALNTLPSGLSGGAVISLIYLAFAATSGALLFQNIGQKYTEPTAASVLLSLEAPFGVLFSIILFAERPSVQMFLGFGLIFIAIICSETKFSFLKGFLRKSKEEAKREK